MKKRIVVLFVAMLLAIPSLTFARGGGGGGHASFSSHSSSFSSHSSYSSHTTYSSRPTVNLSKSTTTVHHYSTGYHSPSYHVSSYHSSHVTVNHYHVGYSPYSWGGYYHGFTHAMILSSFMHPWGGTYYVGHQNVSYGPSPLAWIGDIVGLIIFIVLIVCVVKLFRRAL